MLAVDLPVGIEDRLDALEKATSRAKADYVREAILEHIDDLEDLHVADTCLAQNAPATPLKDVMKRYGLNA